MARAEQTKSPNETAKKGDFVEIEFTARAEGEIFDTTIREEAKKLNPKAEPKPLIICIGEDMVVKGFDKALEAKEIGKKYSIKLNPEEAFGKRFANLVKLIPKKVFTAQNMNPVAGMTVALDSAIARIINVSGGRVLVDFNNPLAGKEIEYEFIVKRKIADTKEKVNALQGFFFKHEFPFELDEARKKIVFSEIQLTSILNMFKDKFRELTGFDVEIFVKPAPKSAENSEAKPAAVAAIEPQTPAK